MAVLPVDKAKEVTARAYDELQVPVGSPPEQIAAIFRVLCLQRALQMFGDSEQHSLDTFQRQAVAYRFLRSLPLMRGHEYQPEHILARLRPVDAQTGDESNERACAMLDISIATMEQAQRTWQLPYTNFVITVHYCLRKHLVRRRYSEFEALHGILKRKLPIIPELPERNWLYKLQLPSDRAQNLAKYLHRVITMLANRGLFSIEIMEFLEIDFARVRAEEEAFAIDHLTRASGGPSGSGGIFYMLSCGWLESWKRFVSEGRHPPGRINNEHLLELQGVPKSGLVVGRNYRCINFFSWQYLVGIYGGGPVIMRKTASIYGRPVCDMLTLAIHVQRLVRGFLGRRVARRRWLYVRRQDPVVERRLSFLDKQRQVEERMVTVRKYVTAREYQIRHIASIKIQRAFRKYLLRQEHALLMAESAVPHGAANFQHIDEYFSLEEIGLIRDVRLRLAHFLVTMNKGVPIQKLRSRRKTPKWRLFRIDQIGSMLMWSSKKRTHTLAFADMTKLAVESPLQLKSAFGRRRSTAYEHAVVIAYTDSEHNNASGELILICESQCDCDALFFGLEAVHTETRTRTADGASYVDGHGIIRKKYPHAKRLIRDAEMLIDQQQHSPFRMNAKAR